MFGSLLTLLLALASMDASILKKESSRGTEPDVCFNVKLVTKDKGRDMSWEIGLGNDENWPNWNNHDKGICESRKLSGGGNFMFSNNQVYHQKCCLPENANDFLIICRSEYGAGWDSREQWWDESAQGGYLEIDGNRYCEDFSDGREFNATLPNDFQESALGEVCTNIKLVTSIWANEIFWSFGKCFSSQGDTLNTEQGYANNGIFIEECCQEAGSYELLCEDSYGDGWHGAYVEIEGTQYCNDFLHGEEKTEEATMNGEWNRGEWIMEVDCPNTFSSQKVFSTWNTDVETAQTDCAAACNENEDCRYAWLFQTDSQREHDCFNQDEDCGDWMNDYRDSRKRLWIKT